MGSPPRADAPATFRLAKARVQPPPRLGCSRNHPSCGSIPSDARSLRPKRPERGSRGGPIENQAAPDGRHAKVPAPFRRWTPAVTSWSKSAIAFMNACTTRPRIRLPLVLATLGALLTSVTGCFPQPATVPYLDGETDGVSPETSDDADSGATDDPPTTSDPSLCGNGSRDPGETCDSDCPTECNDDLACTADEVRGSANQCTAECSFRTISECVSGDGCCPGGCDRTTDEDCPECGAECQSLCGNLQIDAGEECDDGNRAPMDGCESDCSETTLDGGWLGETAQAAPLSIFVQDGEIAAIRVEWFVAECDADGETEDLLANPVEIPVDGSGSFRLQKTDIPVHISITGSFLSDDAVEGTLDLHYQDEFVSGCESDVVSLSWRAERVSECGDGDVDAPETCDDGNDEGGDTCPALCSEFGLPATWTCDPLFFDADDGCDCGCGVVDPDCSTPFVDACGFCDGCAFGNCANIDPGNNGLCVTDPIIVPAEWICDPLFFGTNDGCDCGCQAFDPDCIDLTSESCGFCESCLFLSPDPEAFCTDVVDPQNNTVCLPGLGVSSSGGS